MATPKRPEEDKALLQEVIAIPEDNRIIIIRDKFKLGSDPNIVGQLSVLSKKQPKLLESLHEISKKWSDQNPDFPLPNLITFVSNKSDLLINIIQNVLNELDRDLPNHGKVPLIGKLIAGLLPSGRYESIESDQYEDELLFLNQLVNNEHFFQFFKDTSYVEMLDEVFSFLTCKFSSEYRAQFTMINYADVSFPLKSIYLYFLTKFQPKACYVNYDAFGNHFNDYLCTELSSLMKPEYLNEKKQNYLSEIFLEKARLTHDLNYLILGVSFLSAASLGSEILDANKIKSVISFLEPYGAYIVKQLIYELIALEDILHNNSQNIKSLSAEGTMFYKMFRENPEVRSCFSEMEEMLKKAVESRRIRILGLDFNKVFALADLYTSIFKIKSGYNHFYEISVIDKEKVDVHFQTAVNTILIAYNKAQNDEKQKQCLGRLFEMNGLVKHELFKRYLEQEIEGFINSKMNKDTFNDILKISELYLMLFRIKFENQVVSSNKVCDDFMIAVACLVCVARNKSDVPTKSEEMIKGKLLELHKTAISAEYKFFIAQVVAEAKIKIGIQPVASPGTDRKQPASGQSGKDPEKEYVDEKTNKTYGNVAGQLVSIFNGGANGKVPNVLAKLAGVQALLATPEDQQTSSSVPVSSSSPNGGASKNSSHRLNNTALITRPRPPARKLPRKFQGAANEEKLITVTLRQPLLESSESTSPTLTPASVKSPSSAPAKRASFVPSYVTMNGKVGLNAGSAKNIGSEALAAFAKRRQSIPTQPTSSATFVNGNNGHVLLSSTNAVLPAATTMPANGAAKKTVKPPPAQKKLLPASTLIAAVKNNAKIPPAVAKTPAVQSTVVLN